MAKYVPGMRFGRLTTVSYHHRQKNNNYWLFKCDCGSYTIQDIGSVAAGKTKSCGCYHREESAVRASMQFTKHGLRSTRLYSIWKSMKVRCLNPNSKSYKDYGCRGITICNSWATDFKSFYDWAMSSGYADNLTIDRIDVNKNYTPENCRWATQKQQCLNKRNTKFYNYNGIRYTVNQLSTMSGIPEKTLRDRLKSGWEVDRAIHQAPRKVST